MLADLAALPPTVRRDIYRNMGERDLSVLLAVSEVQLGTPYGLWVDDPAGFILDVIGDALWSMPTRIADTVTTARKVAVPSCYGSSKTWTSARLAVWHSFVHPPGTALTVTLAPKWRQVVRLIWPEIRRAHKKAGLPGHADMAQLKITDRTGLDHVVAYGLAAEPRDESAVQGIHAAGGVLLIVEEAGGIHATIGRSILGALTGADSRMLAIGNPPTSDEGGWFEELCAADDVVTIPITAQSTPNLSGERPVRCHTCPPTAPVHALSNHLIDQQWVDDAIRDNGIDSPYCQAKIFARFPKGGGSRIIPSQWLDGALDVQATEPDAEPGQSVRLCDLGLPDETDPWVVAYGAWIRLGVDVASDGGDEFVVARQVGDLGTIEHYSAGATNADAINVAGKVLVQIRRAEALRAAIGSEAQIRVKVDVIGLGWGVVGALTAWGKEGVHDAAIVAVNVAEATDREPDGTSMIPDRKRDELWLTGRTLVQPDPRTAEPQVRLRVDKKTASQLRGPKYGTTMAGGRIKVESKKSMRERGLSSPDRGEAWLLCVYEPAPPRDAKKKARLVA
jgi:hypothetical protein